MERDTKLVLVVEVDPPVRELLSDVLSDEGYEVMTAYDGEDARKLAASGRVDVVTIDLDGPESTAGGLMHEISAVEAGPCIVALSSSRPPRCGVRLAHAVLLKPFDVNELVDVVRRVLRGRRSKVESRRSGNTCFEAVEHRSYAGSAQPRSERPSTFDL